ncbi:MAG: LysM peptidoglycan-binding domain-containing protein [Anaerolineales bacterium]|jgi:LysM repeat protein
MKKNHQLQLVMTMILMAGLVLTACERPATSANATPPSGTDGATGQSDTQATMDAVRAAILTQTAEAGGGATPTPTAEPTNTPEAETTGEPEGSQEPASGTDTPSYIEYTVQPGEWIWEIARAFDVDPEVIIEFNNLSSPNDIEPGMVLKIPSDEAGTIEPEATTTAIAGGVVHVVQPGEWIWQIARQYGVDPQAIIDANNLVDPGTIYPGQELIIP